MSQSSQSELSTQGIYEQSRGIIDELERAWGEGSTLVPLLGAGVSIECGMPAITEIVNYLAAVHAYVSNKVYRPRGNNRIHKSSELYKELQEIDERYKDRLIAFVEHYGWPERFELQEELYNRSKEGEQTKRAEWINASLEKFARDCAGDWRVKTYKDRIEEGSLNIARDIWEMLGDWRKLIAVLTRYNSDYADALFERLYRGRQPGMLHDFWAMLSRTMGLRLFFTINFDPFLEMAFRAQGIEHTVFGIENGDELPPPSLVRENTSIIKLHGDTHRLLLGERLDHPPSNEYLAKFTRFLPRRPILLVMGCGGGDPRIMGIIKHCLNQSLEVVWLHFEANVPAAVEELNKFNPIKTARVTKPALFKTARVTQPALFLSHLYARLTGQHPASRVPYKTIQETPIGVSLETRETSGRSPSKKNIRIFSALDKNEHGGESASLRLAHEVHSVYTDRDNSGIIPVWINLETHYSVSGVVGTILRQCHRHDRRLPPLLPPTDRNKEDKAINVAVAHIARALRRSRYILAFDSLEAFAWPPTMHHGVTESGAQRAEKKRAHIFEFLQELIRGDLFSNASGSFLYISIDRPTARHGGSEFSCEIWDKFREFIRTEKQRNHSGVDAVRISSCGIDGPAPLLESLPKKPEVLTLEDCFVSFPEDVKNSLIKVCPSWGSKLSLVLFGLSCFRRQRHWVALRRTLQDFLNIADVPNFIHTLISSEQPYLIATEGAEFRMSHSLRDAIYTQNSKYTQNKIITESHPGEPTGQCNLLAAGGQSYALAIFHDCIARYYYADNYMMSSDPSAFLEYLYHRISSIRYLTKLSVVTAKIRDVAELKTKHDEILVEIERVAFSNKKIHELPAIWQSGSRERTDLGVITKTRHDLLQRLLHGLERTRRVLQAHTSAAQLIEWFQWVLDDDLGRDNEKWGPSRFEVASIESVDMKNEKDQEAAIQQAVKEMRGLLLRMCGDYYVSACDFTQSINLYRAQIRLISSEQSSETGLWSPDTRELGAIQEWLERSPSNGLGDDFVELITPVTNLLLCLLGELRCGIFKSTRDGNEQDFDVVRACLSALIEHIEENVKDPHFAKLRQSYVRLLCMRAEADLENKFLLPGTRWSLKKRGKLEQESLESIEDDAKKGLRQVRVLRPENIGDPQRDRIYIKYLSRLHVSLGRVIWLRDGYQEEAEKRKEALRRAERHFELARAGAEVSDGVRVARAELAWVECLLVRSDSQWTGESSDPVESVYSILLRAGEALQRARNALERGQREYLWWRTYYRLWAQYQSEWVLWHLAELQGEIQSLRNNSLDFEKFKDLVNGRPQRAIYVIQRLKRGLYAIQCGKALQPRASDGTSPQDPMLERIGLELMSAGLLFGIMAIAAQHLYTQQGPIREPEPRQEGTTEADAILNFCDAISFVCNYWKHLQGSDPDSRLRKKLEQGLLSVDSKGDKDDDWRKRLCNWAGTGSLRGYALGLCSEQKKAR
ncbi:MAG: hypothetical protein Tsb0020_14540 [Haliangiales bacterium]